MPPPAALPPVPTEMGDRVSGALQRSCSRVSQLLHLGKVGSTHGCTQLGGGGGVLWGDPPLPSSLLNFPQVFTLRRWHRAPVGAKMPILKR